MSNLNCMELVMRGRLSYQATFRLQTGGSDKTGLKVLVSIPDMRFIETKVNKSDL